MLRCHILPAFGGHRLDAITRTEVKAFARALAGRLAPITVRIIVTVLGLVLREAIDEHYLLFDPTARLRLRDGPDEPRATATPEQIQRLAARMPNLHARTMVITAAYTGMRFGELAGLSRANVHLDRALIHVAGDTGALHEVSGNRWLGPPQDQGRGPRHPATRIPGRRPRTAPARPPFTTRCSAPMPAGGCGAPPSSNAPGDPPATATSPAAGNH